MDNYLHTLTKRHNGLEVRTLPGKGRCLFATKKFHTDDPIITESPIVSIQNVDNNHVFPACHNCCTPLGSLEDLIRPLLRPSLAPTQKAPLPKEVIEDLESEFCNVKITDDFPLTFPNIDEEDTILSPVIPCIWECGALFCSEACRTEANLNYHVMLCTGYDSSLGPFHDPEFASYSPLVTPKPVATDECSAQNPHTEQCDAHCKDNCDHIDEADIDAGKLFEKFCLTNNDYYVMLARFLFQTIRAWYESNNNLELAMAPIRSMHSTPWWRLQSKGIEEYIQEGQLVEIPPIFREFHKPEKTYTPDNLDFPVTPTQMDVYESIEEARVILMALVRERLPKLIEYINHVNALTTGSSSSTCDATSVPREYLNDWEMHQLFSVDSLSNFLGAIDLNNIEMKSYSPLVSYLDTYSDLDELKSRDPVLYQALQQIIVAQRQQARLNKRVDALHDKLMYDSSDDEDSDLESMDESGDDSSVDHEVTDDDSDADSEHSASTDASIDTDEYDLDDIRDLLPHMSGLAIMNVGRIMNHSCAPNAHTLYTHSDNRGTIYALRDIEPGEEICASYIDVDLDLTERRDMLNEYGFFCTCNKCMAEEAAVETK